MLAVIEISKKTRFGLRAYSIRTHRVDAAGGRRERRTLCTASYNQSLRLTSRPYARACQTMERVARLGSRPPRRAWPDPPADCWQRHVMSCVEHWPRSSEWNAKPAPPFSHGSIVSWRLASGKWPWTSVQTTAKTVVRACLWKIKMGQCDRVFHETRYGSNGRGDANGGYAW